MGILDRFRRADSRPLASGTRADGFGGTWSNPYLGLGSGIDRDDETVFDPGVPMPHPIADAFLEFNAIARRIVNREPDDASREGYWIEGVPETLSETILNYAEDTTDQGLTALGTLCDARRWSRAYGGGAVIGLLDDGRMAHEPLDLASLRAVRGLEAVDRYELTPLQIGRDPNNPSTFGKTEIYSLSGHLGAAATIHASRVIPFDGIPLPRRVKRQRNGWGGSVLDLIREELQNYGVAHRLVPRLLSRLTQGVFKSAHLGDAVLAENPQQAANRMEAIRVAQGIMGDIMLDEEHESYELHQRQLSGMKDAIDAVVAALVAADEMPRSILLGETPGGLNAGENAGEIRAWYDVVATRQKNLYGPRLRRILRWIMRSHEGPTAGVEPEGWRIEWAPLWQLTETEQAALELSRAQRRQIDVTSTVVSAAEVRRDPALVELYGIDPTAPPPADATLDPGMGDVDDEIELMPTVSASPGDMPPGEALISARTAAQRLGCSPGTVHAGAARGEYPAWRVGSGWRFAWSLIAESRERRGLRAV